MVLEQERLLRVQVVRVAQVQRQAKKARALMSQVRWVWAPLAFSSEEVRNQAPAEMRERRERMEMEQRPGVMGLLNFEQNPVLALAWKQKPAQQFEKGARAAILPV